MIDLLTLVGSGGGIVCHCRNAAFGSSGLSGELSGLIFSRATVVGVAAFKLLDGK